MSAVRLNAIHKAEYCIEALVLEIWMKDLEAQPSPWDLMLTSSVSQMMEKLYGPGDVLKTIELIGAIE